MSSSKKPIVITMEFSETPSEGEVFHLTRALEAGGFEINKGRIEGGVIIWRCILKEGTMMA